MQIPESYVTSNMSVYVQCIKSRAAILYSLKLIQSPIDIGSEEWKQAGA